MWLTVGSRAEVGVVRSRLKACVHRTPNFGHMSVKASSRGTAPNLHDEPRGALAALSSASARANRLRSQTARVYEGLPAVEGRWYHRHIEVDKIDKDVKFASMWRPNRGLGTVADPAPHAGRRSEGGERALLAPS